MAQDQELLQVAIDQATANYNTYATNYRDLRENYAAAHGKNWRQELARDIAARSDIQVRSAMRTISRYEAYLTGSGSQARNPDHPRGNMREALREIGRTVEPLQRDAPPDGLRFKVDMKVGRDSEHGSARRREADIYMPYNIAVQFIQDPNYYDLFDQWYDGGGDNYGEDGDYEADIYSVSAA